MDTKQQGFRLGLLRKITKGLPMALLAPFAAWGLAEVPLDPAPLKLNDQVALQRGAQTFVNYCLSCHSAAHMRYNRLTDLGLTEQQIKDNLLFAADKVGETMTVAMKPQDAKAWFGAPPPDLTVIARSRGADWLYTYMRGFYRDDSRPTGWNNLVYENVGMPHPLYELQGMQVLEAGKPTAGESHGDEGHAIKKLKLRQPGKLTPLEYDNLTADLVSYLVYMGEPARNFRIKLGIFVLFFLAVLFVSAYALKREYWKDVH